MNRLHELIYQIASNPKMVSELMQDPYVFMQRFNLTQSEVVALETSLATPSSVQALLSPEKLHQTSNSILEQLEEAWIG